ncbi:MAG: tyrosine-type recombinase/integrase [Limibaculum sp.]
MSPTPKTVHDAAEAWLKRCAREELDNQTLKTYRSQVNNHILPRLGDRVLADLRRADIRDFVEEMLDENSRAMTRKVLVSLKSLLKEVVEREWIDASPAAEIKLKWQKRHDKRIDIPTKEEIRLLMHHAPDRHRAMIVAAVFTGMRISELRGLTWDHVDLTRRIIEIRQRANRLNEMGSPKSSAGNRDIPMAPMVVNALEAWRSHCPVGELGLVFPNGAGNVESYGNIMRRVFYPLQEAVGIVDGSGKAKYGFHALRHAAASMMIEQKWPAKKIQVILGHSSIMITFDCYGHLFTRAEDDVELFEKMEQDLMAA